jgi:hypothetical protein
LLSPHNGFADGHFEWIILSDALNPYRIYILPEAEFQPKQAFLQVSAHWWHHQRPSELNKVEYAFTGGVFDGENIWMVPSSADKVIKLSSFSSISVSANVTANDTFYFYISQDELVEGTLIGHGSNWASVYSLNAALVPGVTNYLHIKSTDVSGPIAGFIGDFSLNNKNFHFENNTRRLLTGEECWTVYTDTFGGTRGTITTICKNGLGRWSTRFGIDLGAHWIWTNEGKDHTTRFFSTPIYSSAVYADPITSVRVVDTIPDTNNIIDSSSFTREPYQLSSEASKTTVEWRCEEITMGQAENLSFGLTLKEPVPGEYRPVRDRLGLLYEDVEKRPERTEPGHSRVHVFNTVFTSSISTDKETYRSREDVIIRGTMKSLSEYERSVEVKIIIEDSQGILLEEITTLSDLTFKGGEEKNLEDLIYKTNTDYSGNYRARLISYENLKPIGEASTDFTIEAVLAAGPEALSTNEMDGHAAMTEKMDQKADAEVPGEEIVINEVTSTTKAMEPSIIPEKIEEATSDNDTIEVATELIGTINAQPNPVYQGLAVSISYSVSNEADKDLKDLTVNIVIINPDTEEVKKTFEAPTKARKGASVAGSFILSTAIFEPRLYTAVLQVTQSKKETPRVLASTHFEVRLINVIVT